MHPFNFVTMTEYSGHNALDLSGPEFPAYATFRQIEANGGKVRKGQHGTRIFCGWREKLDEKTGKTVRAPKGATVFHIDQCDIDPGYRAEIEEQATSGQVSPSQQTINAEIIGMMITGKVPAGLA